MQIHSRFLRFGKQQRISVPWVTGIPELDESIDVWVYDVPARRRLEKRSIYELIVSPLKRACWRDLWILDISLYEKIGTYLRLARFLADREINILLSQSVTSNHGSNHSCRLVIDCNAYTSPIDHSSSERIETGENSLEDLRAQLILEFIDELVLLGPAYPALHIHRALDLFDLFQRGENGYRHTNEKKLSIDGGEVCIPEELVGDVERGLGSAEALYALAVPHQDSLALRLLVFSSTADILPVTLRLRNEHGAIACATKHFEKAGMSIVSSNAWTSHDLRYSNLWLLLQVPASDLSAASREELVEELHRSIERDPESRDFDITMNRLNLRSVEDA